VFIDGAIGQADLNPPAITITAAEWNAILQGD
jgi:hypothetical protein